MRIFGSIKLVLVAASAAALLSACEGLSALADRQTMIEVPADTAIVIRLNEGISSAKNTAGQTFQAHLSRAIERDGKVLAPEAAPVTGRLVRVKESGRVKGRAEMTLTLTRLSIGGSNYVLETNPITIQAEGSEKKDTGVIAGTSAVGAIIGAIAGGGKGAAIGAAAGATAGTGAVLYTKGKEVEFGPEARFTFHLKKPLELPSPHE